MTTRLLPGQRRWSMQRDIDGHREYKITFMVIGDKADGPAQVLQTAGLPAIGSTWAFDNDEDQWAWCRPEANVTPKVTDEPNRHWEVELTFSTKPYKRCQDTPIENPLLEPAKVSGGFSRYNEEATNDRNGNPIQNSSLEQLRGPQVEFDQSRPTVKIEMNSGELDIEIFSQMIDTVNDTPLWGLPARSIKLMNVSWERKYYGQCFPYYSRTFEFEVRYDGFDRDILDEGTKVLRGDWDRDELSPTYSSYLPATGVHPNRASDYVKFKDWNGENARVILNGHGTPFIPATEEDDGGFDTVDSAFPVEVANGGSGYVVGDILTITGSYTTPARVIVDDLQILGEVDSVSLYLGEGGVYLDRGSGAITTTGGTGTGCTVKPVWRNNNEPGSIHVERYEESNFLILGIPVEL